MRWTELGLAAALGFSGATWGAFVNDARSGDAAGAAAGGGSGGMDLLGGKGFFASFRDTLSPALERRQAAGLCGADNGNAKCTGNQCCSQFGFCGEGDQFCTTIAGCQTEFGWCEGQPQPSSSAPPAGSSSSSAPPASSSSSSASGTGSSTASAPAATGTLTITTNGMCGNTTTCAGSTYGRCCSQFWYCGSEDAFCGEGCNSNFGACGAAGGSSSASSSSAAPTTTSGSSSSAAPTTTSGSSSSSAAPTTTSGSSSSGSATTTTSASSSASSSSAAPAPTLPAGQTATKDGTCGNNVSCLGWADGECCSQFGFCGSDAYFCTAIAGCQKEFGQCTG